MRASLGALWLSPRGSLDEAEDLVSMGLTTTQPADRDIAAEHAVWVALIRDDVAAARDVLQTVSVSEPLKGLLAGLVSAVLGEPVGSIEGDTDVRRALAIRLGGSVSRIRTARAQAIVQGGQTGYPESALVERLGPLR